MDIILLDADFQPCAHPIDTFSSLSYSDKWEAHGDFSVALPNFIPYFTEDGEEVLNAFAAAYSAKYVSFDGRVYLRQKVQSDTKLVLSGPNLNALFDTVAIYEKERLHGNLESVIRYVVTKYAMIGAQSVPKLVLGSVAGYKNGIDVTTTPGSLSEWLYSALSQRGFSYSLEYNDDTDEITFNLLRGTDRTTTDNPIGFSSSLQNIEAMSYQFSDIDHRNYAFVSNESDTAPKTVEVDMSYGDPVKAVYISANDVTGSEGLGDILVMVGAGGMIKTSPDGINWTTRTSNTVADLWSIDYQNGLYIAGGTGGIVDVSSDGVTWTVRATGSSYAIEGVGYVDGIYFAFDSSGSILYSYDCSTWNYSSGASRKIVNSVFAKTRHIAFSIGPEGMSMVTSTDGSTWSIKSDYPGSVTSGGAMTRTCLFGNNVVGSGYAIISGSYVPITTISSDYGLTQSPHIITSLSGKKFLDMASGLGVLVAVGQPNIIAWSTDGITWTDCTPGTAIDYISVTFDGSKFYAVGNTTRKVAISEDGKNWTVYSLVGVTANPDAITLGTSEYTFSLRQAGVNALRQMRPAEVIDGNVLPGTDPVYKTDYNLGDIVDVSDDDRGIVVSERIIEVRTNYEPSQIVTVPKFGTDFLTLRQYISKEAKR